MPLAKAKAIFPAPINPIFTEASIELKGFIYNPDTDDRQADKILFAEKAPFDLSKRIRKN